MRIAVIIPDYPPIIGGAEIFASEIYKRLSKNNEVHIITRLPTRGTFSRNNLAYVELPQHEKINENLHIHRVRYIDVADIRLLSSFLPIYKKTLQVIKDHNIDIIHSIMIYPAAIAGAMARNKLKKPHFFTEQGFLVDVIRNEKTITELYFGILKPFLRYAIRNADRIHSVSIGVDNKIKSLVPINKTIIIPNGVDTKKFLPGIKADIRQRYNIPEKNKIVVTISRLVHKNGIEYLIQALKIVSQKHPDTTFLIVGGGPLRDSLSNFSKELGLKNVIFTEHIPSEDTPKFLAASDIFTRPSLTEGFGISFVEAMSAGLAVIATDAIKDYNIINHLKTGLIVRSKDANGLAESLNLLLENESLRKKLGKAARKDALARFDWDSIASQLEYEMQRLLEQTKQKS